jgi:hypothetical protein
MKMPRMPWHQGLLYGRNPAKCLVGLDRPQSPRSIMEGHNNALPLRMSPVSSLLGADRLSSIVKSGSDPHGTLNVDGVRVRNRVRHGRC